MAVAAASRFPYLPEWRVVLCKECGFGLRPGETARKRHLGREHGLRGAELRTLVELLQSYGDVWTPEEGPPPRWPTRPVPGLRVHDGFRCASVDCEGFLTRSLEAMERHGSKQHGQKAKAHVKDKNVAPLWETCRLQTFYAETKLVCYFVVDGDEVDASGAGVARESRTKMDDVAEAPPDEADDTFFRLLGEDARAAAEDAKAGARIVEGFDSHRSAVVPWLRRTGIADHIRGLDKVEMQSSFALPRKKRGGDTAEGVDGEEEEEEGRAFDLLLGCMEQLLTETHRWCFDGPECKLTWPRQLALSRFRTTDAVAQKQRGFDPKKERSTVETNFRYWKQLISFYFHVVHRGRHFAHQEGSRTPEDSVRPTDAQAAAWDVAWSLAVEGTRMAALRGALLDFSMALICHEFGGYRYRSALLSFAALQSIETKTGAWRPAGNFSSFLSGLIWAAQLVIFCASVGYSRSGGDVDDDDDDDEDEGRAAADVLRNINGHCRKYMRPDTETPMGEILGWRLLCRAVGREEISPRQATWDEDEQGLTYGDVHLRMDHVRELFSSEVERARRLLYGELMFGVTHLPRLQASALKDDPGRSDVGWFFGRHRDNEAVLRPLERALERTIQSSEALRNAFLDRSGSGGVTWRAKAIAHYEAVADDFLTTLVSPFHMANGQVLREGELFSILLRNTQRHRNVGLKHGRVMVHVTYHKGQQQTGKYKDNIRFLHPAFGDMLVDYIIYVLPLLQAFLRHSRPGAVLSPYLWSKDGRVWGDNRLTRCMEKACARTKIPRLHIANWRQMTASIVKTKFGKEDARCFGIDDGDDSEDAEEIDEDVQAMTKQRNHSTHTVNHAYSNQQGMSFGSVWDGLVRRGLRASTLWHQLWGLDTLLAAPPDRKRDSSEAGLEASGPRMVKRIAMGTYRRRKTWTSKALLKQAKVLHKNEALQWRSAAQERAMVAVTSRAEQVVVVMATGEGKSLLFVLPCVLPEAGVTILVLPLVSLRGDLVRRVRELGIEYHVWSPEEPETSAPLVFATVEAAATSKFRSFAARLAAKQELDRIVVDEAHLTVTASDYRQAMVDLALIRSVRTQFVYLTATLPPSMQGKFEEQNHLVRPRVVRASTNRKNLFYMVQRVEGRTSLLEEAASRARDAWCRSNLLDQSRDKIIIYVRSKEEATELASLLGCAMYTSTAAETAAEKEQILDGWVTSPDQPYIVSTSALSVGFDYAHVRLVIHMGEPHSLVDFAQEAGRAGRDGAEAYSVVFLRDGWQPDTGSGVSVERRALHGYLEGRSCRRHQLSGHLDLPSDVLTCRGGVDVTCDVCCRDPEQGRETGTEDETIQETAAEEEMEHTGSAIIEGKRRASYLELSRYKEDLLAVEGTCLLCRGLGEPWDHAFEGCPWRFDYFKARDRARRKGADEGGWIAPFHACYWCYNPQSVCARADPEARQVGCSYGDIVMPLCYGLFQGPGGACWLRERIGTSFQCVDDFLLWCGKATTFGGGKAIQGACVAAAALAEFGL